MDPATVVAVIKLLAPYLGTGGAVVVALAVVAGRVLYLASSERTAAVKALADQVEAWRAENKAQHAEVKAAVDRLADERDARMAGTLDKLSAVVSSLAKALDVPGEAK